MSNEYNTPAFRKLLQKLQEESWQLELLISGFAIFGLFSAITPLQVLFEEAKSEDFVILTLVYMVILISCIILLFSLLIHVILRALWIGSLGLRYVSGDIDYDYLNYSPRFTKFLKKKVGSFDRYVARLENYCSIIFAMSFLLIFYVFAFIFTICSIVLIAKYLIENDSIDPYGKIIGIPLLIFIIIGMIFVFIDFATQGWLKRKKWISRIYFPFFWFYGIITFSFLYRPLVYNFLDNKFGRRISLFLLPLYVILILATTLRNNLTNYFGGDISSTEVIANRNNYLDLLQDERDFVKSVAIDSKVITKHHLGVFFVLDDKIDDHVFAKDSTLTPNKDIRGFSTDVYRNDALSRSDKDSIRKQYMKMFNSIYKVYIDTVLYESEFVFSQNIKKQRGFETFVNVKDLEEGKHTFKLIRLRERKPNKDTLYYTEARIPFWYYPD